MTFRKSKYYYMPSTDDYNRPMFRVYIDGTQWAQTWFEQEAKQLVREWKERDDKKKIRAGMGGSR